MSKNVKCIGKQSKGLRKSKKNIFIPELFRSMYLFGQAALLKLTGL